jgi:hypothetical protein
MSAGQDMDDSRLVDDGDGLTFLKTIADGVGIVFLSVGTVVGYQNTFTADVRSSK